MIRTRCRLRCRLIADAAVRLGSDMEGVHQARWDPAARSDLRTFRSLLSPRGTPSSGRTALARRRARCRPRSRRARRRLRHTPRCSPTRTRSRCASPRSVARPTRRSARPCCRHARGPLRRAARSPRGGATAPAVLDDVASAALDVVDELISGPWGICATRASRWVRSADADLHAARIRPNACGAVRPAPWWGSGRRFAVRAAALQDELGEHQDSVVAAAWLRSGRRDQRAASRRASSARSRPDSNDELAAAGPTRGPRSTVRS
jgi:hypothetical protein